MGQPYRRVSGFSLTELMFVVAIISMLAIIGIPSYHRFSAKARQSEAKTALSAIYAGEKAFSGEFTTFVSCMNAIGFTPESNKGSYTSGFSNTTITSGPGFSFATCAAAYSSSGTAILSGTTTAGEVASNGRAFTAQSQGIIILDSPTVDIWQIDNTRNLINTQPGL